MYDGLFKRKSTIADHVTTPFRALILSNGIIYVAATDESIFSIGGFCRDRNINFANT